LRRSCRSSGHLELQQEPVGGQEPAGAHVDGRFGRENGGLVGRLRPAVVREADHLKVWAEEGPPKGTLYHYPNPYKHQVLSVAAARRRTKIAEQITTQALQTQMAVRYFKGEQLEKTLDWASGELEGFMRN